MTKLNPNNGYETKSDIFPYSNPTPYLFWSKNINLFQWLSKSKLLSFMTKVNPNNGDETISVIFLRHISKSDTISFFCQKILKYWNDFQNSNSSVLLLKWTQTMEIKQNQTFSFGTYSHLTSFFIDHKTLKYFNDFYNWHFSVSLQIWAQTSKVK